MASSDNWTWWRNALNGNFGPMHEGEPQQGFYRVRNKGGQWFPVAIWKVDGEWRAMRGNSYVDPAETWNYCRMHPVTHAAYKAAMSGNGWEDEPALPSIGHNMPDDPYEALRLEFEAECEQVEPLLAVPVTTQAQADKLAILAKRLTGISNKAKDLHREEKGPHLEAGRKVDEKWRDLKEQPEQLAKDLKGKITVFLKKLQDDAAKLLKQKASENGEPASEETTRAKAGRTGATVSLRTYVVAKIIDYDKAIIALKDHPEMRAFVQTLADRAVKAGVPLDGVERTEEQRAV